MIKIGQYNKLTAHRRSDFGWYLTNGDNPGEVLLPQRYVPEGMHRGDVIEVFVYTDSEDRPVATTERPLATVGEFAYLDVAAVNATGAFMDWGLAKDLLVPFNEQRSRIHYPGRYLVYVYLDDASGRVTGTTKVEKYLDNVIPHYKPGKKVDCLVYKEAPIGLGCIVDNLHRGMLYADETFRSLRPGDRVAAYVKKVRPDGKIDLTLNRPAVQRTATLGDRILAMMEINKDNFTLNDKSDPEVIKAMLQCSKRDFKQAMGHLLRDGKIVKTEAGYALAIQKN